MNAFADPFTGIFFVIGAIVTLVGLGFIFAEIVNKATIYFRCYGKRNTAEVKIRKHIIDNEVYLSTLNLAHEHDYKAPVKKEVTMVVTEPSKINNSVSTTTEVTQKSY